MPRRSSATERRQRGPHAGARSRRPRALQRRAAYAAAALVAAVASSLLVWRVGTGEIRRHGGLDVLLVTIDTLRADAVGAYGGPRGATPWIDRLASGGVLFEVAYAHNVVTQPSHANILSGRYPFDHGVRENAGFRFPADVDTLATLLAAQGYRTGAFVSGFPVHSRFGLDRGFETYDDRFGDGAAEALFLLPERPGAETAALARRWIAEDDGRPWFCWVHLYDPHAPYRPAAPWAERFAERPYYGDVAAADAALGSLIEPLLGAGRDGGALVVLTSDHGEGLGDHGEMTHGFFAYQTTLRVPLVMHAPRILDAARVPGPARHVDLLPTVLDALELPAPDGLPGRSLLPMAVGVPAPGTVTYFEALSGMLTRGAAPLYGVVRDQRKYVDLPIPELYDLDRDPGERENQVERRAGTAAELRGVLSGFRAQDGGVSPLRETGSVREQLAALGYLGTASAPAEREYTEEDDPKRLVELDALMERVIALHRDGHLEQARRICLDVVERRPAMSAAFVQLAMLERTLGRPREAIAVLRRAIARHPEDLNVAILLAGTLNDVGEAGEAATLLEVVVGEPAPPFDALVTHGVALAQLGRHEEALGSFRRAHALDPSNAMTLLQIATVQLSREEDAAARDSLGRALQLDPRLAAAHRTLGLIALKHRDDGEAERRLRRAVELQPDEHDALLNLGRLLARLGRPVEARPYLERFSVGAPAAIYEAEIARVRAWLRVRAGS